MIKNKISNTKKQSKKLKIKKLPQREKRNMGSLKFKEVI